MKGIEVGMKRASKAVSVKRGSGGGLKGVEVGVR
jgi:hypothetical protein